MFVLHETLHLATTEIGELSVDIADILRVSSPHFVATQPVVISPDDRLTVLMLLLLSWQVSHRMTGYQSSCC